ncbi:Complex I [Seminavis robusta]|uniref:Complex I n=1 Tax=Seminavis robusta TaxID=568900 RepID=A0A9N8DI08_9STRA|nr:Complex I [Seminavis robusta]|eukprot:Sro154_g070030.1 Complex I (316) ;mRNA; f:45099-46046
MFRWIKGGSKEGGGSLRMYIKFREQMFRRNFEPLANKSTPIALWDLSRHDDAIDAANCSESGRMQGWRISDDGVIDGYSRGRVSTIRSSADYQRWMAGEELKDVFRNFEEERRAKLEKEERDNEEVLEEDIDEDIDDNSQFVPFLRWSGHIDTTVGLSSDAQRSGFCAIRAPEYPYGGANLQGLYNALEIVCRTDGRLYTVNLQVASFFPGDMYQGYINVPATHPDKAKICTRTGGEFERLVMPFTKFALTAHGRLREMHRTLDSNIEVQTVGFTLMDGKDGDFQFDLARIRAVNFDGHGIAGEEGLDEPVKIAR